MPETSIELVRSAHTVEHVPFPADPADSSVTDASGDVASDGAGVAAGDAYAALDDVDFLDDIDFSLDDVESRIAPLALAHN